MNNLKAVRMDDHSLLLALTGIISAFGLKEVWAIIQKKMDIGAKKEEREESFYIKQISDLTTNIGQLEAKIEALIEENVDLKLKIVEMGSGLVNNAKKRTQRNEKSK